jgi:uncharacterized OB-fold protein
VDRSPADVYAEFCARGELAYQLDEHSRPVFRPRVGYDEWRVSAGRGTVYATTVIHRPDEPPASVVLVDLDEGFRMMSRVVGLAPEAVRVGLRVRVRFCDGVPEFESDGDAPAA